MKKMLINVLESEEIRVAFLEESRLEEIHIERTSQEQCLGNIYKGVIENVEPSMQAAFVNIAGQKSGFLHVSDVRPEYRKKAMTRNGQPWSEKGPPPMQAIFKRGSDVIVQVTKEGIGKKGPSLTTYLSIPGRYMVLMPRIKKKGVSRKIEDPEKRERLRKILGEMEVPDDMGVIVRTAGEDRSKADLVKDLHYLLRLWKTVVQRAKRAKPPSTLYKESDLLIRTIRDSVYPDTKELLIDSREAFEKAKEFIGIIMPRFSGRVKLYEDSVPLFKRYHVETEIEKINDRTVPLPTGGSLVIEPTEALVAIDVNSGKYRKGGDPEETAFKTNLAAATEIARQLRLRDLGGQIVIDFIDLEKAANRRKVEQTLAEEMKRDRARTRVLRMSLFGIVEMTRQRVRPALKRTLYQPCPMCGGSGLLRSTETMALSIMRLIRHAGGNQDAAEIVVEVNGDVAAFLLNNKRREITEIEESTQKKILITGRENLGPEETVLEARDSTGQKIRLT